jgi:hypothetical protein
MVTEKARVKDTVTYTAPTQRTLLLPPCGSRRHMLERSRKGQSLHLVVSRESLAGMRWTIGIQIRMRICK